MLGSLIPRSDDSGISPVFTLGPEALALEHRETVAELLNRYPQFVPDRNSARNSFDARPGVYGINLRGLGTERNLVLIDGRRLGPSGATAAVDTNMLPVALLDRIEILTGGASSTYGADAMSGVVNFKLRRNVDGVELGGSFEQTEKEDGDTYNLFALGGTEFADGQGQLTGFISHFDRDGIPRSARDISAQQIQEDISTGTLFVGGDPALPGGYIPLPAQINGEPAPLGVRYDEAGNPVAFQSPADLYNSFDQETLVMGMHRTGLGLFPSYTIGDSTELSAALVYTQNEVDQQYAPSPTFPGILINLDNPLLSEANRDMLASNFDPAGRGVVSLPYFYRAVQAGNRRRTSDTDSTWLNLEATGRWLDDWQWTAAYTASDYQLKLEQKGGISEAAIRQAVLVDPATGECRDPSGGCAPADIFGAGRLSDDALSFITVAPYTSREDTIQQVVSLRSNGFVDVNLLTDIGLAAGLEWRRDENRYRPDPRLLTGSSFGYAEPVTGKDDVSEVYGEVLVPLLRDRKGAELVELELGARYSDYSKAAGEWTWKAGTSWVPVDGLRLRASYNRAARAPNMDESYRPYNETVVFGQAASFHDPCAASNRPQDVPGRVALCTEQGIAPDQLSTYETPAVFAYISSISGNLDLETEVADTYTLGLVWVPPALDDLRVSVDYYDIEIKNYIIPLSPIPAFEACYLDQAFCKGIERAPQGQVTRLFGTYFNSGRVLTDGVDLTLNYGWDHRVPWEWPSRLEVSVAANWLHSFELVGTNGSWECAGRFGTPCERGAASVLPRYRSLSQIHYRTGPLSATLSWQWLDGSKNATPLLQPGGGDPVPLAVPKLGDESYFDLTLGWDWNDRLSFNFAVINLGDTEPPLLGRSAEPAEANTDPSSYDVLGRRYQASVSLRF